MKKHPLLSQQHAAVIPAVAQVLAWSQKYMRERKVHMSDIHVHVLYIQLKQSRGCGLGSTVPTV